MRLALPALLLSLACSAAADSHCKSAFGASGPFVGIVHVGRVQQPRGHCVLHDAGFARFQPLELHERADRRSKVIRRWPEISAPEPLRLVGTEYLEGIDGALVEERRGAWYRVNVQGGGTGWVHRSATCDYRSLKDLLVGGVVHLTGDWDGLVYEGTRIDPDRASRPVIEGRSEDVSIEVQTVRMVAGRAWARVEVLAESPCESELDEPGVVAQGWIPVFSPSGCPAIWFSPGGCKS